MIPSIIATSRPYEAMITMLRVNLDNRPAVGLPHSLMTPILRLSVRVAVLRKFCVVINLNHFRNNLRNDSRPMAVHHQCQTVAPYFPFRRFLKSQIR